MARRGKKNKALSEYQLQRVIERNALREQKRNEKREKKQRQRINHNKMEEKILIAVYDDLRKGMSKHKNFENSKYLGTFFSLPVFTLWDLGGIDPMLTNSGTTSIKLEVYEVNKTTLEKIDTYQSYFPESPNNSYALREKIETPFGVAEIYFLNDEVESNPAYELATIIKSGDWVDNYETNRTKQTSLKI